MAKLRAQLTFRLPEAEYDQLQEIATKERRKMNEIARALLERGVAAYKRDQKLFEPEVAPGVEKSQLAERPATIKPRRVYDIGKENDGKKKKTG